MHRNARLIAAAIAATMTFAPPALAAAHTKTVYAGSPPGTKKIAGELLGKGAKAFVQKYAPSVNAFALQTVTINEGDAVKWVGLAATFHNVDLPGKSGHDLPFIAPGGTSATGVNDFAGSPFWFDGHVPSLGFNPQLFAKIGGTAYNGSQRVDSGAPAGPSSNTFKVTFTKPGLYKYFCDIHPGMVGYVVVRAKGKPIPSTMQDAATLSKQITANILSAKKLASTKLPAGHVSVGAADANGVELYAMFPATLTVESGSVVTFLMSPNSREVHTASFGPVSYLMMLANSFRSPAIDQRAIYPSSSPTLGPIQFSPASHGNGFANTGGLDRDATTPLPPSAQIKFTTPGTYHYICLIHPYMQGVVVVK
jgi:plastocyanin